MFTALFWSHVADAGNRPTLRMTINLMECTPHHKLTKPQIASMKTDKANKGDEALAGSLL